MLDKDKIKNKIDNYAKIYGMDNESKIILNQFSEDIDDDLLDLINFKYGDLNEFTNVLKLQRKLTERLTQELLTSKYDKDYNEKLVTWAEDEGFIPKRNSQKMKTEWLKYAEDMTDGLAKDAFIELIKSL